jgi:deazaflavin-dependent oxidoreductase (nitroreductase family)
MSEQTSPVDPQRRERAGGGATAEARSMGRLRRVDPGRRRGPLYRSYAWLSATRPFGWVARRIGWKLDPVLLRLTGGRLGAGLLLPTAVLETRGARTGAVRRNALIYFHDGDDVIVMAAHVDLPNHPSWFHNLLATPDMTFGGQPFRASVVEEDVDRLWAAADRVFPPYAHYRRQAAASGRTIPLVRLSPRSGSR